MHTGETPLQFSETFFSIHDKTMRGIGPLALSAFFMPRCSALHTWDAVVFFHSNPLMIAPFAAQRGDLTQSCQPPRSRVCRDR